MITIISNCLKVTLISYILSVTAQTMDLCNDRCVVEKENYFDSIGTKKQADVAELATDNFSIMQNTGKKALKLDKSNDQKIPYPPKSYRVLQLMEESKLYSYHDASLDVYGSREWQESKANYSFSQSTFQSRAISLQPGMTGLKNEVDIKFEEWCENIAKEREKISESSAILTYWNNNLANDPSKVNENGFKSAQRVFSSLIYEFLLNHGATEVMLRQRKPTEEEIKEVKRKIYSKSLTQFLTQSRGYRSSAIGTPYQSKSTPTPFTQGFVVEDYNEIMRICSELKRRVIDLQREFSIMTDVWLAYNQDFLPKVNGWQPWQLLNWTYINSIIEEFQEQIKINILRENPLPPGPGQYPRERTTNRGKFLTAINQDERGKRIRIIQSRIQQIHLECPTNIDVSLAQFCKYYIGEDELDRTSAAINIQETLSDVTFEKIKKRRHINDEERYFIRLMGQDPGEDELKSIESTEIAVFLTIDGQNVCWKIKNKEAESIQVSDLSERLKTAVKENKDPTPEDRRLLLDLLLNRSIFRFIEPFNIPKNVQMIKEYPAIYYVVDHKIRWKGVFKELKQKPQLKHNPYDQNIRKKYDKLYNLYQTLLRNYTVLLMDMYTPSTTSIPSAWQFWVAERYQESLVPTIVPGSLDLSQCSIYDEDLQLKTKQSYAFSFCPVVNLSGNALTGSLTYSFTNLTRLNVSHNYIQSLNFLAYLNLVVLNLSHNRLSDLSGFVMGSDQKHSTLQELDLSYNAIEDIGVLSILKGLKKLDVSNNKLQRISNLFLDNIQPNEQVTQKENVLECLKANDNLLTRSWRVALPTRLARLVELEIMGNKDLGLPRHMGDFYPADFFEYYPSLTILKTDDGDEEYMSMQPPLHIDLSGQSLGDLNVKIIENGKKLVVRKPKEPQAMEEVNFDLNLIFSSHLTLSNNRLTGNNITINNFSSNRIVKMEIVSNKLQDINFIQRLTNLIFLDISDNLVLDLTPLKKCESLAYLDISDNDINNLASLSGCTTLTTLKASRFNQNTSDINQSWHEILPTGLIKLDTLEICKNGYLSLLSFDDYKSIFPSLKSFKNGYS